MELNSQAVFDNWSKWFWTLRYLSLQQIQHRGRRMLQQRWRNLIKAKVLPPSGTIRCSQTQSLYSGLDDVTLPGPWKTEVDHTVKIAHEIGMGNFTFLNHSSPFRGCTTWNDPELSQLWRYHLHYFNYALDLALQDAISKRDCGCRCFRNLAASWMECNRYIRGDGWHPYTISLRIVNWLEALAFFRHRIDKEGDFVGRLTSSIYSQAQFLFRNLELDVRGNHLLKNLRALIWCGTAFSGPEPEAWYERAIHLLKSEIEEQVLPDGGHFERTPGYHAVVFSDFLETGIFLRRNDRFASLSWLDEAIGRMLKYLLSILPPDGRLPLIKDTAWDAAPLAYDLLTAGALYLDTPEFKVMDGIGLYPLLLFGAEAFESFKDWRLRGKTSGEWGWEIDQSTENANDPQPDIVPTAVARLEALQDSGFFVLQDPSSGDYLIFDAGKVCPDYLPAHAHADLFSYELMFGGKRIVVDSGIYEYAAGPWRDYFRSTRAHNTVEVAGCNQSEVWSSFRVARRATPFQVSKRTGETFVMLEGKHDGYCRLKVPVIHRRILLWEMGTFWLMLDELQGNGTSEATNYIHFHPEIQIEPLGSNFWQLKGAPRPLWVQAIGAQTISTMKGQMESFPQGWYSEAFGQKLPNSVIALHNIESLPFLFGYIIAPDRRLQVSLSSGSQGHYELRIMGGAKPYSLFITPEQVDYII